MTASLQRIDNFRIDGWGDTAKEVNTKLSKAGPPFIFGFCEPKAIGYRFRFEEQVFTVIRHATREEHRKRSEPLPRGVCYFYEVTTD